jgi:hypothetical protein
MRFLFFVQGKTVEDQMGYDGGFRQILKEGGLSAYQTFPWLGYVREHGWDAFFAKARECVEEFQPDAIYLQFFHDDQAPDSSGFIKMLRRAAPQAVIAVSAGDPFSWNNILQRKYPQGFLSAATLADVTFTTSMGRCADYLARSGVGNIVLLPLGACQIRFVPKPIRIADYKPDFDVVFIGNGGWRSKNPRYITFWSSRKRDWMVNRLQKRYGKRFGLFGNGWSGKPSWQGSVSYAQQMDACRNSQVVFGGCPGSSEDYYTSDRPFIQGVSGIPLVDWYVPRADRILRDQDHWYLVHDANGMIRQIDRLLETDAGERLRRGAETAEYIHKKLSQEAFMRFFVNTISAFRNARLQGGNAPLPALDFFLPETDLRQEKQFALRNWQG